MRKFIVVLLPTIIMLFAHCHTPPPTPTSQNVSTVISNHENSKSNPTSNLNENKPADRFTSFTFNFLKHLQAAEPADDNLFVSPLSLHMAMSMLLNGASGTTYEEMAKALHIEGMNPDTLNSIYRKLMQALPQSDHEVNLLLANSIWYRNTFSVSENFTSTLKNFYNAQVTPLSFTQKDVPVINNWAKRQTNSKIEKVIDEIKPTDVLFLLNALYFKGDWAEKFDKARTQDADFTLENGQKKTVKMMQQQDDYLFARMDEFSCLQLPYGKGNYILTLILPNGTAKIKDVLNHMDAATWKQLQSTIMRKSKVRVGLPRFQISYSVKLNATLKRMGIEKVFTKQAELQNINADNDLLVSFVKQDTYLGVDEEGTEAAAVTSIGVGITSMPEITNFICNRPFGFIISEKTTNSILFTGRIMNPDSK